MRRFMTGTCFVVQDGTAKIADVGMAKFMREDCLTTSESALGTFAWAAPELLLGQRCVIA